MSTYSVYITPAGIKHIFEWSHECGEIKKTVIHNETEQSYISSSQAQDEITVLLAHGAIKKGE